MTLNFDNRTGAVEQVAKRSIETFSACRPVDPERFLSREMLEEELLAIKLETLLSRVGYETECDWRVEQ